MRQDDLLAYLEREEDEKYQRVNQLLISFTHKFVLFFFNMVFFFCCKKNAEKEDVLMKKRELGFLAMRNGDTLLLHI